MVTQKKHRNVQSVVIWECADRRLFVDMVHQGLEPSVLLYGVENHAISRFVVLLSYAPFISLCHHDSIYMHRSCTLVFECTFDSTLPICDRSTWFFPVSSMASLISTQVFNVAFHPILPSIICSGSDDRAREPSRSLWFIAYLQATDKVVSSCYLIYVVQTCWI